MSPPFTAGLTRNDLAVRLGVCSGSITAYAEFSAVPNLFKKIQDASELQDRVFPQPLQPYRATHP